MFFPNKQFNHNIRPSTQSNRIGRILKRKEVNTRNEPRKSIFYFGYLLFCLLSSFHIQNFESSKNVFCLVWSCKNFQKIEGFFKPSIYSRVVN